MQGADEEGFDATTEPGPIDPRERLKEVEELLALEIKKKDPEKNDELIEALLEEYDKLSNIVGSPIDKFGKEVEVSKYRPPIAEEKKQRSIWGWGAIFATVISGITAIALLYGFGGPVTTETWGDIFVSVALCFPIYLLIGAGLTYVWRQKHGKIIVFTLLILVSIVIPLILTVSYFFSNERASQINQSIKPTRIPTNTRVMPAGIRVSTNTPGNLIASVKPTRIPTNTRVNLLSTDVCSWFLETQFIRMRRIGGVAEEFGDYYKLYGVEGLDFYDKDRMGELVEILRNILPYQTRFLREWKDLGPHPDELVFWQNEKIALEQQNQAFDAMIEGIENNDVDTYLRGLDLYGESSMTGLKSEEAMLSLRDKCIK